MISEETMRSSESRLKVLFNDFRARHGVPPINTRLEALDHAAKFSSLANVEDPNAPPTHAVSYDQMVKYLNYLPPDIRNNILTAVNLFPGFFARTNTLVNIASLDVDKKQLAASGGTTSVVAKYLCGVTSPEEIFAALEASGPHNEAIRDAAKAWIGIDARQGQNAGTYSNVCAVTITLSNANADSWTRSTKENSPIPPTLTPTVRPTLTPTKAPSSTPPPTPKIQRFFPMVSKGQKDTSTFNSPLPTPQKPVLRGTKPRGR